jgi:hypothetical protein
VRKLLDVLLGLLSTEQQPARHWRYTLMASAMLMFVLPPMDAPLAEVLPLLQIYVFYGLLAHSCTRKIAWPSPICNFTMCS